MKRWTSRPVLAAVSVIAQTRNNGIEKHESNCTWSASPSSSYSAYTPGTADTLESEVGILLSVIAL